MSASDKIYLITGANRGIGNALLQCLAHRPDVTILAGCRDPSQLSQATQELIKSGKVYPLRLQAGDKEANRVAAEEVAKKFGKVDVAIVNAGVNDASGPSRILEMQPETIQKNVEVNTYGTLLTIQAFAPLLQASSNPQLACISASSCSITKPAGVPINPYSTSKAALNFITATLAFEERWLKVQSIHPGVVSSDMGVEGLKAHGVPDEIAAKIFITPDQSAQGVLHHVDAGTTANGMLDATPGKQDEVIPY